MTDETSIDLLAIEVFAWAPHLETVCEVCLREAAAGKRVAFAFLEVDNYDEFLEPAFVRWSFLSAWIYRILHRTRLKKVRMIQSLLSSYGVKVLTPGNATYDAQGLDCTSAGIVSADDLRSFRIEGAWLGIGVLSSLVWHCKDSQPDLRVCRRLADRLLKTAYHSFSLAADLIQRHRPNQVLVFNGRFACSKGIEQAAIINNVDIFYHEAGATFDRYYLSRHNPHNVARWRNMIIDDWARGGSDRTAIAEQFFKPARGGTQLVASILYRNRQKRGLSLPPIEGRRIVYFASSMHEEVAVEDDTAETLFPSQHEAVTWLATWVKSVPDTELVIRLHPRMAGLSPRERTWWKSFASESVTVLSADSPIDSYALAASADRVICYRSSMGPEATYLGKVTIAIGGALYIGLDCVYEPKTIAELEDMLLTPHLAPKPARNCLPLGYSRQTFGTPFRIYRPTTYKKGSFYGRQIPPHLSIISRGLAKVLSVLHHCLPNQAMLVKNPFAPMREL
jgi:hypothetical protein